MNVEVVRVDGSWLSRSLGNDSTGALILQEKKLKEKEEPDENIN